jgi:hypothetical protein
MQQEGPDPILDACRSIEARLREVRQGLLEARPEATDRCQDELQQIAQTLGNIVEQGGLPRNSAAASTLFGIQQSARALGLQAGYASNLCSGLLQLRLGAGYTEHGHPLLVPSEPASSFEA